MTFNQISTRDTCTCDVWDNCNIWKTYDTAIFVNAFLCFQQHIL